MGHTTIQTIEAKASLKKFDIAMRPRSVKCHMYRRVDKRENGGTAIFYEYGHSFFRLHDKKEIEKVVWNQDDLIRDGWSMTYFKYSGATSSVHMERDWKKNIRVIDVDAVKGVVAL